MTPISPHLLPHYPTPGQMENKHITNISHSLTKSLHSLNLAILTFVNFAASVLILIAKRKLDVVLVQIRKLDVVLVQILPYNCSETDGVRTHILRKIVFVWGRRLYRWIGRW